MSRVWREEIGKLTSGSVQSSQPATLLVVIGAGASHDSVAKDRYFVGMQPPLTVDLFRRPEFAPYRNKFVRLAGIMPQLLGASASGVALEQLLADLQSKAAYGYATAAREMASIRYYLKDLLQDCSASVLSSTSRATTYAELIRRLDEWSDGRGEGWRVCLVSFNYDSLLEAACADIMRWRFENLDDYLDGPRGWMLLKPHGSCDWAQEVIDPRYPPSRGASRYPDVSRARLIDDWPELKIGDRFFVHRATAGNPDSDSVALGDDADTRVTVVPAISLAVTDKSHLRFTSVAPGPTQRGLPLDVCSHDYWVACA